jgi:hypothetical protein
MAGSPARRPFLGPAASSEVVELGRGGTATAKMSIGLLMFPALLQ